MSKPKKDKAVEPIKPGKTARPAYEMPAVAIGDVVLWNPGIPGESDAADVMALVTDVHTETIAVAPLHPGTYNFDPVEGVRHAEHHNKDAIRSSEVGTWRHRPSHLALLQRVRLLEEAFGMPDPTAAEPAAEAATTDAPDA